jgi:hypothetical protein
MSRLFTVLVLGSSLFIGLPLHAHAQGDSASSEYSRAISGAVAEFQRGHFSEARALFEEAHRLEPSARTLRGLGFADFGSERYALAVTELDAALTDTRKPLEPDQRREVEEVLSRAHHMIGHVTVTLSPAHARLRVNGAPADGTRLLLEPGEYRIEASAPGHASQVQQIPISAGEQRSLAVALVSLDAARTTDPGRTQRTAAWIVGGVGVVGVVVGSVSGVRSIALHDESERHCSNGPSCSDARGVRAMDSAIRAGNVSTVAFVVGAVGLAGSAVLWLTAPEHEATAGRTRLGAGLGSLRLESRW